MALHPDWSPDGARLAFAVDDPDGTRDVWTSDWDGSNAALLVTAACPAETLTARPGLPTARRSRSTGSTTWTATTPGSQLQAVDVATGAITMLASTTGVEYAGAARWSPDGRSIVVGLGRYIDDGNDTEPSPGRRSRSSISTTRRPRSASSGRSTRSRRTRTGTRLRTSSCSRQARRTRSTRPIRPRTCSRSAPTAPGWRSSPGRGRTTTASGCRRSGATGRGSSPRSWIVPAAGSRSSRSTRTGPGSPTWTLTGVPPGPTRGNDPSRQRGDDPGPVSQSVAPPGTNTCT